jgi:hypothetical protein
MTTALTPSPFMQFFTAAGVPLSGGKLYTYAAGTSTPLTTYTDYNGGTANTNPVVLDSRGEAAVWLDSSFYKFILKDSTETLIWTADNISGGTSGSGGSALVGYLPGGTSAVATNVQSKLRERISVFDFMTAAQITSVTSRTSPGTTAEKLAIAAAIQAADTYAVSVNQRTIWFPAGTYYIGNAATGLTLSSGNTWEGEGNAITTGIPRGATIYYEGTGFGISATSIRASALKNLAVYCTAATYGIGITGSWLGVFESLQVSGTTSSYAIYIASSIIFNSEENLFSNCFTPEGVFAFIGAAGVQLTTTTAISCRSKQWSVNGGNVTFINCTAEGWGGSGSAYGFKFDGTLGAGPSRMLSCDIEGGVSGDTGILIVGGAKVIEWGTVFEGLGVAATKVSGLTYDQPWYGGSLNFINGTYSVGSALNSAVTWSIGGTQLIQLYCFLDSTTNGHLQILRQINGTVTLQADLKNRYWLQNDVSCDNSAVTTLTIPIPTGVGVRVRTTASGLQAASGVFCVSRECVVANTTGTLTATSGTALTAAPGGGTPVITYTVSSTNLLVQFNHGSATPASCHFEYEIDGAITAYTLA